MTTSPFSTPDSDAPTARVLELAPPTMLREMTRPWAPGRGDTIVAAVSGGADSVALAALLIALAPGRGWRIVVATLDHRLRGEEGDGDRRFVERLAARCGVPCVADARPVSLLAGRSAETAARDVRRAFLLDVARDEGAAAIALGHTADDQAETVLFRLARGTGTPGLGGMRRRAGRLWRPLLEVRRAALRSLLDHAGLAWREDPTNRQRDAARNRIRLDVLPALESALGGAAVPALVRAARLARDDESFLAAEAARRARDVLVREDERGVELDRHALEALPPALAARVVRLALASRVPGARLAAGHVSAVLDLARAAGPGTRADLPHGVRATREGGRIVITGSGRSSGGTGPR